MSNWKWRRLYQTAQTHQIAPYVKRGMERSRDDFFLQQAPLPPASFSVVGESITPPTAQRLTNPLLNKKLQTVVNQGNTPLLTLLITIARHILTEGISLRQLTELGLYLRSHQDTDTTLLREQIRQLRMERIVEFEVRLLVGVFHFKPEEVDFVNAQRLAPITQDIIRDIFQTSNNQEASDLYFTQGDNVFVSTNDTGAMMWHVRHSIKYARYFPAEAVTNFFANFAHSLSHIEE